MSEAVFLLEAITVHGRVSEAFATHEEAMARAASLPAEDLVAVPLIYRELPDGSQRIVRDDGKPLQAHRHAMPAGDAPLPLEEEIPLGEMRAVYTPQEDADPDAPPDPLGRARRNEEAAWPLIDPDDPEGE